MDFKEKLLQELKNKKTEETNFKKEPEQVIESIKEESTRTLDVENADSEFEAFKKEFLNKETTQQFISFIEANKIEGADVFTPEYLAECKMKHPDSKVMVLDPNLDEKVRRAPNKFFIIKPLYPNEYTKFIKDYGPREKYPEEFMEVVVRTCVLFPENITYEQYKLMPSGTTLTLYHTAMEMSDFNKPYKILEI